MLYQLSSYIKKHSVMDIRQKFTPTTPVKFNGIILYSVCGSVSFA